MPTIKEILAIKTSGLTFIEAEIDMAILEIEQQVRIYTNLATLPEALNFTIANMSNELLRYQDSINSMGSDSLTTEVSMTDVSSIKIGDTQIALGGNGGTSLNRRALKSHLPNLDQIVFNYRDQLNKFRKMVW